MGFENTPSLSPDGNQVAFSWNGPTQDNFDVYVKLVGPGEPLRLTSDLAGDGSPAWSPDGRQIAFLRFHSEISADVFIVPALGGAERKLATISLRGHRMEIGSRLGWFADISWSPDGKWIAFGGGPSDDHPRGIWLIGVDRSEVRQLTESGPNDTGDWWPTFSPDGRYLAFVRLRTGNRSAVYVLPLTSGRVPAGAPIRITPDTGRAAGLAWTPDSRAVVFSWGGHLNPTHLYRVGLPQAAGSGVSAEPELLSFGERGLSVSISSTGRLVYEAEARDASIWKIPLTDGENPPIPALIVPSTLNEETPAYSPDGTRLAFASTRSGSEEIWIANADGSKPVQMTSMGGPQCANPQWSPDGRVILFNSRREGSADLYLLNPDGGEIRRITDHPDEEIEPRWSRDGRTIYFGSNRTGRYEVWKMAAAGGPAVRVTSGGGMTATESIDGRFLYYAKGAIAPNTIWRVALAGGKEEPVVDGLSDSTNFAVAERGLYFLAAGGSQRTTSIDFFDFATRTRTTILSVGKRGWYGMAVSPDQRTPLYATIDSQDSNLVLVDGFK